jgi:hypothetical protein
MRNVMQKMLALKLGLFLEKFNSCNNATKLLLKNVNAIEVAHLNEKQGFLGNRTVNTNIKAISL